MQIKFSKEQPEIYKRLHNQFEVRWEDGLIIANHDTIHCKFDITPEKIVHEKVHLVQQNKMGLGLWWDMYLGDDAFRLDQEVEAYRAEANFLKRHVKDRELVFRMKREMAEHLASKTYGSIITVSEAMKLI